MLFFAECKLFIFSYQNHWLFPILVIQQLGEQLKVKQQVIATAIVYFKRFYVRNSLKCIDPLLMAPTCVFLASKVEEFGVISNTRLISTCQTVGMSFNIKIILVEDSNSFNLQWKTNFLMHIHKNFLTELIMF